MAWPVLSPIAALRGPVRNCLTNKALRLAGELWQRRLRSIETQCMTVWTSDCYLLVSPTDAQQLARPDEFS